jgi:RNA polymerase sigma factor (sigma-70 family)
VHRERRSTLGTGAPIEKRLILAAQLGDRDARDRVVLENLGFVRALAGRYRDLGLPFEDLVQEGVVGLLQAIDDYRADRAAAFSTYAFWHIRRAMTRALTNEGRLVRLPRQVVERRRAVLRAWSALAAGNGHAPSPGEIGEATGLSTAAVEELLALPAPMVSLDEPIRDTGLTMAELFADLSAADPEVEAVAHERGAVLAEALAGLSERKRAVIAAHFGLDGPSRSLQQVGHELRLSAQRTRELEQEALFELDAALRRRPGSPRRRYEGGGRNDDRQAERSRRNRRSARGRVRTCPRRRRRLAPGG